MESAQLTRMRSAIELWNAGDYEAILGYVHPDTAWHLDPVFPDLETLYEGRDELRGFFEAFVEPWEQISMAIDEIVDERPGQILVKLRFSATARQGMEVDVTFFQIYRLDDKFLVTEFFAFADEGEARREAGLAGE